MKFEIREELPDECSAIREVIFRAFGRTAEADLVERLRDGGYGRLSLVAVAGGKLVGHIYYSALEIVSPRQSVAALSLAPLAVVPERQSRGIGTALVRQSLALCRQQGHRIAIVVGHPDYYPRFGFSADLARPLESPYAGDACMAIELAPGALTGLRGCVQYAPPFAEA